MWRILKRGIKLIMLVMKAALWLAVLVPGLAFPDSHERVTLAGYLELSDDQTAALNKSVSDWDAFANGRSGEGCRLDTAANAEL